MALPAGAAASAGGSAVYSLGYADAMLRLRLGWAPASYRLQIDNGVVRVTLPAGAERSARRVRRLLLQVPGVREVRVEPRHRAAADPPSPGSRPVSDGGTPFPAGDLFRPLIADPKEPRFFSSYRVYWTPWGPYHVGAVGYGGTLGLYRWARRPDGGRWQVDFAAGAFSQFNLDVASPQLLNTDFTVGVPLTWRRGADSLRLSLYHQSSHLGPRYFVQYRPTDYALSYEAVDALWSHEWRAWRVYGGGAYLLWPQPHGLKRPQLQGGIEYRGSDVLWGFGRLVAGLDVKGWAETAWNPDASLKLGLEYAGFDPARRSLRILLEGYSGRSPHGQFYKVGMGYVGLGAYLGF